MQLTLFTGILCDQILQGNVFYITLPLNLKNFTLE